MCPSLKQGCQIIVFGDPSGAYPGRFDAPDPEPWIEEFGVCLKGAILGDGMSVRVLGV